MSISGVFANHAHVFPAQVNPKGTTDCLLRLLDNCGIARAVCFAPFAHQCEARGVDGCCNAWLAEAIKPHAGRLVGFGTLDLRRDNVTDQVKHVVDLGFRGLKLHPNAQHVGILDARAMRAYAAAEEHHLFISFHSGVHQSRLKDCRVLLFDEIAWQFPRLRFSLEHVGGYHFFNEALAVLFNHVPPPWNPGKSNVFAGLTSVFSQQTNRFWYLSRERLLELVAQVGAKQLIFGLDFPYNGEAETKLGIETIHGLGLSEEDSATILGGNLARELSML
jgi:predicted TIM-barrel fold metal-dependent hydrolase